MHIRESMRADLITSATWAWAYARATAARSMRVTYH